MTTDTRHTNDELTDENAPDAPEDWGSLAEGTYREYYNDEQALAVVIQQYEDGGEWHVATNIPNEQRGGLMDSVEAWTYDSVNEACEKAAELLQNLPLAE